MSNVYSNGFVARRKNRSIDLPYLKIVKLGGTRWIDRNEHKTNDLSPEFVDFCIEVLEDRERTLEHFLEKTKADKAKMLARKL